MVRDQIYSTGGGSLRAASRFIHGSVMGPRMVSVPKLGAGLQHAPLVQALHLGLDHPEAAEDLGVMLAELGGDAAHPHALADLDRVPCAGPRPIPRRSRIERCRGGA